MSASTANKIASTRPFSVAILAVNTPSAAVALKASAASAALLVADSAASAAVALKASAASAADNADKSPTNPGISPLIIPIGAVIVAPVNSLSVCLFKTNFVVAMVFYIFFS